MKLMNYQLHPAPRPHGDLGCVWTECVGGPSDGGPIRESLALVLFCELLGSYPVFDVIGNVKTGCYQLQGFRHDKGVGRDHDWDTAVFLWEPAAK